MNLPITINVKSYIEQPNYLCPTIYEFDDIKGNHWYFRERHGAWRFCLEHGPALEAYMEKYKETLWSGAEVCTLASGECEFGAYANEEDFLKLMVEHGITIIED